MNKTYRLFGLSYKDFKPNLTCEPARLVAILALILTWTVWIPSALLPNSTAIAEEEAGPIQVLVIGDSLSAGYNLPPGASFPARLEDYLLNKGWRVEVTNAGVSGDTTSGGRARIGWALAGFGDKGPDLVILELGGNDALRGIEPQLTRDNLQAMIAELQEHGTPILLAGMQAPPNMGREYEAEFNGIYSALAEETGVALYPFFLEGVAAIPELNLDDGIHPNEAGIEVIVRNIAPKVESLLPAGAAP